MRQTAEAVFPGYVTPRTVFFPCLQAGDARHHGQFGPEGQFYARLSVATPQVQLLDEVVVPVVCNDTCPGPVAHSGAAAGAAHHQGHLHPRGAEFGFHGSDCSTDHEIPRLQFLDKDLTCPLLSYTVALAGPDSAVSVGSRSWHCLGQVDDMPAGVSFFLGRVHRYTAKVPLPSGRGRGGGDAGSLLPGVLPPKLGALRRVAGQTPSCSQSSVPPPPPLPLPSSPCEGSKRFRV